MNCSGVLGAGLFGQAAFAGQRHYINAHNPCARNGAFWCGARAQGRIAFRQGVERAPFFRGVFHNDGRALAAQGFVVGSGFFPINAHVGCQAEGHVGVGADAVELVAFEGAVDIEALPLPHEIERQNVGKSFVMPMESRLMVP